MGYIFALVLFVMFLLVAVTFWRGRSAGRGQLKSNHPLEREEPAADESTPGLSDTAEPDTIAKAQKKIPPA